MTRPAAPRPSPRELFLEAPVAAFDALFDEEGVGPRSWDDVWGTVRDADVITALDHMTREEVVVHGRALLEEIRRSDEPRWVDVLRIGLDFDSDEPARLAAVVRTVKGL